MIRGLDVASVDANTHTDWVKAHAAGAAFVYLRKMQHVYPDTYYVSEAPRARAAGLVVGAYLLPGWGIRAASAAAQVAAFKNAAGAIIPGKDLPPVIDVESGMRGGFVTIGRTQAQLSAFVTEIVLEVEKQLNVTPMIYTSYNQYYDLGCPAWAWASRAPLWLKTAYRLSAHHQPDTVPPVNPHIDPHGYYRVPDCWGDAWQLQQYQGDALGFPGFNRTVDLNRLRGAVLGDRGDDVKWIQRKLILTQDGIFGPVTEGAVKKVQTVHGLPVTGSVDAATFAAISWLK